MSSLASTSARVAISAKLVWLRRAMITVFVVGIASMIPAIPTMNSPELVIIPFIAYGVLGVRITHALPANPIGWTFLFIGATTGLSGLAGGLIDHALAVGDTSSWWAVLGAWINGWFWYPLFMAATIFTFLLFPTGLPSRRWRPVAWTGVAVTVLFTLSGAFQQTLEFGDNTSDPTTPNPLATHLPVSVTNALDISEGVGGPLVLALLAAAMVAPVLRYRRGSTVEREQLRWFAFAAVLLVAYVPLAEFTQLNNTPYNDLALAVILTLFPISCGLAILRYRLFEIDRIISRTTSYAIVTALVVGTYAVVVTTVTTLMPDSSNLAVAGATLVAAALARPLLRGVQSAVDRRFDRTRYNQRATVETFGRDVRNLVDADDVQARLLITVGTTLQPATSSLWAARR